MCREVTGGQEKYHPGIWKPHRRVDRDGGYHDSARWDCCWCQHQEPGDHDVDYAAPGCTTRTVVVKAAGRHAADPAAVKAATQKAAAKAAREQARIAAEQQAEELAEMRADEEAEAIRREAEHRARTLAKQVADMKAGRGRAQPRQLPYFLASAPLDEMDRAIRVAEANGGRYAAGDASDTFNSNLLHGSERWKTGWKGKAKQCHDMMKQDFPPGTAIWAVAIAGGPMCDWERAELRSNFAAKLPAFRVKQCGDADVFKAWVQRAF